MQQHVVFARWFACSCVHRAHTTSIQTEPISHIYISWIKTNRKKNFHWYILHRIRCRWRWRIKTAHKDGAFINMGKLQFDIVHRSLCFVHSISNNIYHLKWKFFILLQDETTTSTATAQRPNVYGPSLFVFKYYVYILPYNCTTI